MRCPGWRRTWPLSTMSLPSFSRTFLARWPVLSVDHEAVLYGAATHDIGKVLHPNELDGPGNEHEKDGPALLEQ